MRIAIVGSGISGLTAAYLLHKQHEVHVFEKENWIGGHTHTLEVMEGQNKLAIDTGFIVFNNKTYPMFTRLLDRLSIEKQKSSMSFSVKNTLNGLEYNGTSLNGLFAQRKNVFNLQFLKMLNSIIKLNKHAKNITKGSSDQLLSDFIQEYAIDEYTVNNYLLPMCCAIWSSEREKMLTTPVQFIVNFLDNHGMLNINDRPQWYVVKGGSNQYVHALMRLEGVRFNLEQAVTKVLRDQSKVKLETTNGTDEFDAVIMATHANDTLALLANPHQQETDVLSCFPYQNNHVILHTDCSVLPTNKRAWAAWNYYLDEQAENSCRLSYNMNILQSLNAEKTYCVSVNQADLIDQSKIIAEFNYAHPVYTKQGFAAHKQQLSISGKDNIYFCGAYWRNGFHEDGVQSALHISDMLGGIQL